MYKPENVRCIVTERAEYISYFNKLTKIKDQRQFELTFADYDSIKIDIPINQEKINGYAPDIGTIKFDMSSEDQQRFNEWAQEVFKDAKPLDPELSKLISDNIMDLF